MRKKTRTGTAQFSMEAFGECNEFIKHWLDFVFFISLKEGFDRKICNDRAVFKSAALDSAYIVYNLLKKWGKDPFLEQGLVRGLLRKMVKRRIYDQARIEGYLASSGQIFFPKKWVSWEEYFQYQASVCSADKEVDYGLLYDAIDKLDPSDAELIRLRLAGYENEEIAKRRGYAKKTGAVSKRHTIAVRRLAELLVADVRSG